MLHLFSELLVVHCRLCSCKHLRQKYLLFRRQRTPYINVFLLSCKIFLADVTVAFCLTTIAARHCRLIRLCHLVTLAFSICFCLALTSNWECTSHIFIFDCYFLETLIRGLIDTLCLFLEKVLFILSYKQLHNIHFKNVCNI